MQVSPRSRAEGDWLPPTNEANVLPKLHDTFQNTIPKVLECIKVLPNEQIRFGWYDALNGENWRLKRWASVQEAGTVLDLESELPP